jgi:hypothetical protein
MRDSQAQEIVRMIESNWHFDLGDGGRRMWRQEIMLYDVELATKAVVHLAKRQSYKITMADLSQTLEMFARNLRQEAKDKEDTKALEEGRRGFATPEWVWVWMWARNERDPAEERPFPQMQDYGDPTQMMRTEDYNSLRDEWETAGSPKGKVVVGRAV